MHRGSFAHGLIVQFFTFQSGYDCGAADVAPNVDGGSQHVEQPLHSQNHPDAFEGKIHGLEHNDRRDQPLPRGMAAAPMDASVAVVMMINCCPR